MRLSIIIPVYNAEKYIRQCLDSVLEQIEEEMEIIIVNDGSSDSSIDICKKYANQYSCINLINKVNEGVSKARNIAIEQAKGEWITFLDADDMLQKNSLNRLKMLDSDADIIVCNYSKNRIDNKSKDTDVSELSCDLMRKGILNLPSYVKTIKKYKYDIDGISNWTCWGKFIRTKVIKENSIKFPETITHGEDLLFCYQVYLNATKVYYNSVCLYYYRTNDESVSRTFNSRRITNTVKLFEKFLDIDKRLNNNIDFRYFVADRIIACCKLYYSHEKNNMMMNEKVEQLRELLQTSYVADAIQKCPLKKLSNGKRTNIINILVLFFLKNKLYKQAIIISKM